MSCILGPADPSIYAINNGNSIADDMAAVGVSWTRGQTDRVPGWEVMRNMLYAAIHREERGLFVFETCEQFIETVPSIPRDEKNMDDVDTDAEDHIADESRYRCMTPRYGLSLEQV